MKLWKTTIILGILMYAVVLSPAPALAVNNTCANREAMIVGSTENSFIAASSFAFFATRLVAGRSYVILAWTPFEDASEGGGSVGLSLFSDTTCVTLAPGTTSVEAEEPWSNLASADIDALAIIPATTGEYVVQVSNFETRGVSHRIIIFETSIYSPWWFTGSPNQAFITISNRSNVTNAVTVTMNGSNGTACAVTTVSIPANGNTFIRVNDFPACVTAGFGSSQLAFLSTPGTIQGNTTVLDVVQGISFDEPFVPRMSWVITER